MQKIYGLYATSPNIFCETKYLLRTRFASSITFSTSAVMYPFNRVSLGRGETSPSLLLLLLVELVEAQYACPQCVAASGAASRPPHSSLEGSHRCHTCRSAGTDTLSQPQTLFLITQAVT